MFPILSSTLSLDWFGKKKKINDKYKEVSFCVHYTIRLSQMLINPHENKKNYACMLIEIFADPPKGLMQMFCLSHSRPQSPCFFIPRKPTKKKPMFMSKRVLHQVEQRGPGLRADWRVIGALSRFRSRS